MLLSDDVAVPSELILNFHILSEILVLRILWRTQYSHGMPTDHKTNRF